VGKEGYRMKGNKPTSVPPVTAPGKIKLDGSMENPRNYLEGIDDKIALGHRKIEGDLDPMDHERNVHRMKKFNAGQKLGPNTPDEA
jgi:hypothetical protein